MKATMIAISLALISGCSSNTVKPYASVSAGYNIQETESPTYSDKCNIPAGAELGIEKRRSPWSVGFRHESNFDCGVGSWNPNRPEYSRDQLFIRYKIGGNK